MRHPGGLLFVANCFSLHLSLRKKVLHADAVRLLRLPPGSTFPFFLSVHSLSWRIGRNKRFAEKGVISVPGVFLNEDDYNFDIALRRFKKQVEKAGVLSEMKKRQHYEKPSVMRKKKKAAARKRLMKKMRKVNMG